jgi:hypothetical protein
MQRPFSSPLDEAVNFPLRPVTIRAEEKGTKSMHLERLRSAHNKRRKISRKTKQVVSGFLIAPTLNRAPSWLMARLGSVGTSAAGNGLEPNRSSVEPVSKAHKSMDGSSWLGIRCAPAKSNHGGGERDTKRGEHESTKRERVLEYIWYPIYSV